MLVLRSQNGPQPTRKKKCKVPLSFHPRAGQVLICDFKGFVKPEMVKSRPVIVVSPRLPHRSEIVAVVPISLTAPVHGLPFCVKLSKNYHPDEDDGLPCWAKCDMLMNIGLWRLEGFKIGRRKWATPQASSGDLEAVRKGVLYGLGQGGLIK
ncbi:type II toxin-antitoxin system PemK/MazF family toxin [uncultured Roseobacter sp.]|uniref:type II toxin-antitoxin system PemK/MazF family toxin n=1 Tax=uncultured Roseobacter sp. TaxID=114847 RepID=UPI00345D6589